uniref:Putative multidrug resistance-associated protein lethal(2)03659 n=1 Tax=Melanaphis sacchari TaxID=742174 RepID=A0A2H8TSM5_9HEMI
MKKKNTQVANRSKADKASNGVRKPIIINDNDESSLNDQNDPEQLGDLGIVVSNATAKWTDAQTENSLENINLTVKPGRLVAVIGPVGAGKSSLLHAILRELPLSEGNISVRGVVSYASQEPWLFAGSVQQNILFGLPMDKERYKKVIKVCALKTDFEQFPYGDRTIVGERGVSLSGGQRARINLARAIYKPADIYLLDDPLSAVDTHVGKHLFEICIKGYLKEKTCILITHQLQYLTKVDRIVLMENANILAEGSYQELQASGLDFTKLLGSLVETTVVSDNESSSKLTSTQTLSPRTILSRQVSTQSVASSNDESKLETQEEPIEVAETRSSGNISLTVYSSYFSAGGNVCKISFLLFMCVFTQALASGGDYWITYWVNLEEFIFRNSSSVNDSILTSSDNNGTTSSTTSVISDKLLWWTISRQACVIVFAVLTFTMIISTLVRSATFVSVCMGASMNLHNKMFNAITRATMYFFNTNSSGRILNRFSKDMGAIDEMLPVALMDCIQIGLTLMGIIIVVGIVNIYLMIPTFIVAIIFYKIRVFYLSTSRSVKRLEGVTRSPVFAHLNASLQGLTTIRAFEAEQILSKEFDNHQDLHSSAWYLFISSSRAFGFWLDIVCLIYISVVTFSFLIVGNNTFGGNVGLAITQAIGLTGMFQWGMRQSAELENQMTSVERVLEYTNAPQEDALESSPERKPPTEWPMNGKITFEKFFLRYSTDSQFVIKNLNINIEPMEKVGIVGRTGAGKSSLIAALFRLAINEGNIIIDDIEIHDLGLHELRSKLSIIPQEPFLFSGTMRINLDPFNEYPDHVLWNALDEVELKSIIEDLPNGLNSKVSEGGSNFSVGQKQLVCLARAIIRNNKILILDEATANVDPQTDAFIQNTIKNKFRMCTVLTIAHRLNTVMDSDKVLVMDAGTMVEFDHPYNLLKNKNGFLYKMVEQTGPINSELLHNIASESYNRMISTNKYTVNT